VPSNPPVLNRAPDLPDLSPRGSGNKQAPSPNIDIPDLPPLNQGSSTNMPNSYESLAHDERGKASSDRYARLASYETAVDRAAAPAVTKPGALDGATTGVSPYILLSGEVIATGSGGPRLVINIEPFDHSDPTARFDGNVSLAVLTSEGGVQRRLARWDFGPEDVRSAVDPAASEPKIRFRVELPPGTKVDGLTELWAKLAPTNGASLFSHAKLNLSKPGVFSSRTDKVWVSEESVVAASYVDTSTQPEEVAPTVTEGTWATAKPGKPAIVPFQADEASGGWKAASGSPPAVVETTKPPAPMRDDRPKPIESCPAKAVPVDVARKPAWTPERSGTQPRTARPAWSATR
jgi:hypothetical protein